MPHLRTQRGNAAKPCSHKGAVPIVSEMTPRSTHGSRHRGRGDDGAVVIEAAIAGLIFFTILFGVVEFGLAFFDYLTTSNMSRVGARTGSTLGHTTAADYQILQQVQAATSGMPTSKIQAIVVYKASTMGAAPATGCKTASSAASKCNFYTPSNFSTPLTTFDCTTIDQYWCPTTRKDAASDPPDYLGVYIRVVHPNVTTLFGASYTYEDFTVIRIEAQTP
jgi:Flp pilus assembly protein TadG